MFNYPKKFPKGFDSADVDAALRELLDLNLISMGWDEEAQEFVFFMTEEQKQKYDLKQ